MKHFFVCGMLPEIVGKFYTRKPVTNYEGTVPIPNPSNTSSEHKQADDDDDDDVSKLWCYCNKPSFGDMINCDNEKCTIRWFHFDCLRIRCPPKGKWYCPSCRKLPKFSKKRKTNKSS